MRNNIITAVAGDKLFIKTTDYAFQYDYGLKLVIQGIQLPSEYEVHFCNTNDTSAKTATGDQTGVLIPDEYLRNGEDVHAWVFLHADDPETDGESIYHIQIPVVNRAAIAEEEITPVEHNVIKEALEQIALAVEETNENVANYPYINQQGYWMVYDATRETFVNTGVYAGGGDGGSVIIETEFYENPNDISDIGYISVLDADDIAEYAKLGKRVVFHFPAAVLQSGGRICGPSYLSLVEYVDAYNDMPYVFYFANSQSYTSQDRDRSITNQIDEIVINNEGKLYFKLFIEL